MTKAAINQLAKNLACEWAKDGIRVNSIAPWYTATELANQVWKSGPHCVEKCRAGSVRGFEQGTDGIHINSTAPWYTATELANQVWRCLFFRFFC